jgi:hypothetical protein
VDNPAFHVTFYGQPYISHDFLSITLYFWYSRSRAIQPPHHSLDYCFISLSLHAASRSPDHSSLSSAVPLAGLLSLARCAALSIFRLFLLQVSSCPLCRSRLARHAARCIASFFHSLLLYPPYRLLYCMFLPRQNSTVIVTLPFFG